MTIHRERCLVKRIGSNNYPYVEVTPTTSDSVDGFILEIEVGALMAGTVTVNVIGLLRDSDDPLLEAAGNTHYSVNTGAAASRKIGDLTFDFTTSKVNRIWLKPGTTIGGFTMSTVLPCRIGFLFTSASATIISANVTKRINRMEG